MVTFILWIFFAALVGIYANKKGRSGIGYTFLSILISPVLGFIVVLIRGEKRYSSPKKKKGASGYKWKQM